MRILLAIDSSPCSEAAIGSVMRQFRPQDTDVRVLHVVEWSDGVPVSLSFADGPSAVDQIVKLREDARREGQELVDETAHRLQIAGFHATTELATCDDARHAILDRAAAWHPDLIVLGSHGRRGVDRFLLGSVSENIVRHAPCSVEVVKN